MKAAASLFPQSLAPVLRAAALSLAVAGVFGCEDRNAADKATLGQLEAALVKVNALDGYDAADQVTAANAALTAAAGNKATGPVLQAVADGAVAAFDQQAAFAGALRLKHLESEIRTTLVQLRRLGEQVTTSSAYADAYAKSDPKTAIAEFSSRISAMQGNAQMTTWGVDEQSKLPTLAATKAESDRLAGEVSSREQQLATMKQQRTDALATADQLSSHADQLKGDEALKAYADASESRRKADDLAINIDLVQDQLNRLKSDSSLQQGQATVVDAGIKSLQNEAQLVETDWGGIQKHAVAQKAVAKVALDGDDTSKISLKQTAIELAKQLEDLALARSAVIGQLTEADKYANSAASEAKSFASSIAEKLSTPGKEADVYKALRNAVHEQMYQYRVGTVQRDMGAVATGEAALLGEVQSTLESVKAAISAAELTPPSELDKVDPGAVKQLLDAAEANYTNATQALTNVQSGDASATLKTEAKQALLIAYQGHLRLYELKQAAGDTTAAAAATQLTSDALAAKADLIAENAALPPLPGELGQPPAPATQPATPATPGT